MTPPNLSPACFGFHAQPPQPHAAHCDHQPAPIRRLIRPGRGNHISLSPGERAGVRAGWLDPNFPLGFHGMSRPPKLDAPSDHEPVFDATEKRGTGKSREPAGWKACATGTVQGPGLALWVLIFLALAANGAAAEEKIVPPAPLREFRAAWIATVGEYPAGPRSPVFPRRNNKRSSSPCLTARWP